LLNSSNLVKDLFFQEGVKPSCLGGCPRKAIQHKSAFTIGSRSRLATMPYINSSGTSSPRAMIALASRPKRGAARHVIPQKIARRYLRDTVTVDDLFGLRALPGPGRPRRITGPIFLRAALLAVEMFIGHRNGPF
jgi:hypothetical protein